MAQWKRTQLVTMRTRVQSLVSFSGLRIWYCLSCGVSLRSSGALGLGGRGAAVAAEIRPKSRKFPFGRGREKKKKKKKREREREKERKKKEMERKEQTHLEKTKD